MHSLLLAQTTNPFYQLGLIVIGAIFALGLVGTILLLIARGFWEKTGKPLIEQIIEAKKNEPAHITEQKELIRLTLLDLRNLPAQVEAEKRSVKEVIDNETQRVDGIIRKEITSQVTTMKTDIIEAIKDLKRIVHEDKKSMHDEITQFREDTIGRLGEIDGSLQTLGRK